MESCWGSWTAEDADDRGMSWKQIRFLLYKIVVLRTEALPCATLAHRGGQVFRIERHVRAGRGDASVSAGLRS